MAFTDTDGNECRGRKTIKNYETQRNLFIVFQMRISTSLIHSGGIKRMNKPFQREHAHGCAAESYFDMCLQACKH